MALISCPGCGKMISEKATKCVSCGYVLKDDNEVKERHCKECGMVLSDDVVTCPNCGCPVNDKEEQLHTDGTSVRASKKKSKIIGIVAVVLCVIGIGISVFTINNKKKMAE